jgi:hypothetical protein
LVPQHLDGSASTHFEAIAEALGGVFEEILVQVCIKLWHYTLTNSVWETLHSMLASIVVGALEDALCALVHDTEGCPCEVIFVLDRASAKTLRASFDSLTLSRVCESLPEVTRATVKRLGPATERLTAL